MLGYTKLWSLYRRYQGMIMNYGIYSGDFKGESGTKDSIAEISM